MHGEGVLLPGLVDLLDFAFDLVLLAGRVNKVGNKVDMLVELELDQIVKAEAGLVVRDVALDVVLESLPVAVLHELGVEVFHEGHDLGHVLDALIESKERLPGLDLLVESTVWVTQVRLEVLDEHFEVVRVDLVPHGRGPARKLEVDKRDEIPDILQLAELLGAVTQRFVLDGFEIGRAHV